MNATRLTGCQWLSEAKPPDWLSRRRLAVLPRLAEVDAAPETMRHVAVHVVDRTLEVRFGESAWFIVTGLKPFLQCLQFGLIFEIDRIHKGYLLVSDGVIFVQ